MIPYTYLIGWKNLNKWYYGVRWSKHANPNDLWNGYYTSSKHVSNFRAKHGEPDVIEVRKIFETKERAVLWERRVLSSLDVVNDDKWLNHSNGYQEFKSEGGKYTRLTPGHKINVGVQKTELHRQRISQSLRGRTHSPEMKQKISEGVRRRNQERGHGPALGMRHTDESKDKIREKMKGESHPWHGRKHSEESKVKMRATWAMKRTDQ